jgi:hypothetical protein
MAMPGGADGGANLASVGVYSAGPTGSSIDRVTVTDPTNASPSATIPVS